MNGDVTWWCHGALCRSMLSSWTKVKTALVIEVWVIWYSILDLGVHIFAPIAGTIMSFARTSCAISNYTVFFSSYFCTLLWIRPIKSQYFYSGVAFCKTMYNCGCTNNELIICILHSLSYLTLNGCILHCKATLSSKEAIYEPCLWCLWLQGTCVSTRVVTCNPNTVRWNALNCRCNC